MKRLAIAILATLFSTMSFSIDKSNLVPYIYKQDSVQGIQAFISPEDELKFIAVFDSLGMSKDALYDQVLAFIAINYKDANRVIQLKDKELGRIIGKGLFSNFSASHKSIEYSILTAPATYYWSYSADHTLQVDFKDNRMRIILTVPSVKTEQRSSSLLSTLPQSVITPFSKLADFRESNVSKKEKLSKAERFTNEFLIAIEESEKVAFSSLCIKCALTIQEIKESVKNASSEGIDSW